jgi:hypothetical protein
MVVSREMELDGSRIYEHMFEEKVLFPRCRGGPLMPRTAIVFVLG